MDIRRMLTEFVDDEQGADAVEYALLLSLILLIILGGVALMADGTTAMWGTVSDHI